MGTHLMLYLLLAGLHKKFSTTRNLITNSAFDLLLRKTIKNPSSICPDAYCCSVSTAASKCAKRNNNYHKVCLFTLETCRNRLQRTLLYLSLCMNCNQSEWHKDVRGKFTFLIPAEFYLVPFVRPDLTQQHSEFKQKFKNLTILRVFIFSRLKVTREGQKKAVSLDKKRKDFSNTFGVISTHVSVN
jgi:hypothetical protein